MVLIKLLQPNADERYGVRQGYESATRPPETGLAVLSSYLCHNLAPCNVVCLDPDRSDEVLVECCMGADFVGLTDWFSNHERVVRIARMVKLSNPKAHIVVGGPNTGGVAQLMIQKHPFIDTVVVRDGEQALLKLADGYPILSVPNCWYRDEETGWARFTHEGFTPMAYMPLWDFENFENLDKRLVPYTTATAKMGETDFDPWLVPPLTMFSFRGCMKAIKEGVCSYCTSAETVGRALPADQFWQQLELLRHKYGAKLFYMADDIFPVSIKRMEHLAGAKPTGIPVPMIRAYAYMPDFIRFTAKELDRMIVALRTIGVFNLFFGVESFGMEQITRANKDAVSIQDSRRVITVLGSKGIRATMAYLLGLPGETHKSLEANLLSLRILLETGFVERVYLSVVMALRGTPMFDEYCRTPGICKEYERKTGRSLINDDNPDYPLLQRLGVEYLTAISPATLNEWLARMITTAEQYLPKHRVGGFSLESI